MRYKVNFDTLQVKAGQTPADVTAAPAEGKPEEGTAGVMATLISAGCKAVFGLHQSDALTSVALFKLRMT